MLYHYEFRQVEVRQISSVYGLAASNHAPMRHASSGKRRLRNSRLRSVACLPRQAGSSWKQLGARPPKSAATTHQLRYVEILCTIDGLPRA